MDTELIAEFERGVNDYWSGVEPDGWREDDAWHNPYLAGWLLASHAENSMFFFAESDTNEEED